MLRAFLVVAAIAVGDSLNPSTVAPAVYLAVTRSAVRRILEFSAGVFVTYLVGGVLLLLGPGQLLLSALPHPASHEKHELAIGAGAVLLIVAAVLWSLRRRLAERSPPGAEGRRGSAFAAGATVMLAELPTAFPYFGAIAVVIGSGSSLPVQVVMLVIFNVIFVAPLLAVAAVVARSPATRRTLLEPLATRLARHWPSIFATLLAILGTVLVVVGVAGLAGE